MGLDILEFTLSVEEAFEFQFPEEDMRGITTPGRLIDYLATHLSVAAAGVCLSQRAFYRLRSSLSARIGCPPGRLRPDTPLLDLIPIGDRTAMWDGVRQDIGLASPMRWPRLAERRWLDVFRSPRVGNMREAVDILTAYVPMVIKGRDEGWTREQIAAVVHRLMGEQLGLAPHQFTDDMTWRDMGLD